LCLDAADRYQLAEQCFDVLARSEDGEFLAVAFSVNEHQQPPWQRPQAERTRLDLLLANGGLGKHGMDEIESSSSHGDFLGQGDGTQVNKA